MPTLAIDQRYHTAYVSTMPASNTVNLESLCVMCQAADRVDVDLGDYSAWVHGAGHVQRLFPTLTPGQREQFFMTGICGSCWDRVIGGSEK